MGDVYIFFDPNTETWLISIFGAKYFKFKGANDTEQFESVKRFAAGLHDGGPDDSYWVEDVLYDCLDLEKAEMADFYSQVIFGESVTISYMEASPPFFSAASVEEADTLLDCIVKMAEEFLIQLGMASKP